MQILHDLVTQDEIARLRQYWQENSDALYINWTMEDGRIIDHRLELANHYHHTAWSSLIDRIILSVFDPARILTKWAALQRQTNPHYLHIDDYAKDQCEKDLDLRMYTFIIALDTIPEFKTIVWREGAPSNQIFTDQVWPTLFDTRRSSISESEDLDHIVKRPAGDEEISLADYLTLDGIFTYQSGSGCLFNGKQIHATSYWLKYPQFKYRDLLQIHVLTSQHLEDWRYSMPETA